MRFAGGLHILRLPALLQQYEVTALAALALHRAHSPPVAVSQASGAGNGSINLWAVRSHKAKQPSALEALGSLPAPSFVNGLQIARSARFLVAGLGREPRLGRWGESSGKNGLLIHALPLEDAT